MRPTLDTLSLLLIATAFLALGVSIVAKNRRDSSKTNEEASHARTGMFFAVLGAAGIAMSLVLMVARVEVEDIRVASVERGAISRTGPTAYVVTDVNGTRYRATTPTVTPLVVGQSARCEVRKLWTSAEEGGELLECEAAP